MGSMRGGEMDPRLRNAAVSTYSGEGAGADGGFAVPPDFRSEILTKVFGEDSLIGRTDRLQSSSNTLTLPTDETTPWQTSGGIQSYWTAEGAAKTQSKVALGETTLKLHTLATLVPVSEELLEDAPAMSSYLNRKAPEKMDFKLSDAIVRGTGVGQPLGFLNSPALVTVAAEGAQTADTVNVTNLAKMWGRMPVQSRRTAVWLMHPDAEAQLPLMSLANMPVYMPPGGVSGAPYGSLWGRPVIAHQVAETIGDLGDVMLVDLGQYLTATKIGNGRDANGMKSDVSIHLWFDQDMVAFRFTMRVAGQPWWAAAISQRDGSNTQSPSWCWPLADLSTARRNNPPRLPFIETQRRAPNGSQQSLRRRGSDRYGDRACRQPVRRQHRRLRVAQELRALHGARRSRRLALPVTIRSSP
jgi:HK97 family phage major capsid protein